MRRMLASLLTISLAALTACSLAPKPPSGATAQGPTETVKATVKSLASRPIDLRALAAVDTDQLWLGSGTEILASSDGGRTWAALADVGALVNSLDFISPQEGWAATAAGLLATADGGKSWQKTGVNPFTQVDFVDATRGFARDESGVLLTSGDGGNSWTPLPTPCGSGQGSGAFSFLDAEQGWLLCVGQPGAGQQQKQLYRTDDGGQHWQEISASGQGGGLPAGGYAGDLFMLDGGRGWLSLTRGGLWATVDGGDSFSPISGLEPGEGLKSVRFISGDRGYLLYERGGVSLVGTEDGGTTWALIYPSLSPLEALPDRAFSKEEWLAVGHRLDGAAILVTADGGKRWEQVGTLGPAPVLDLSFPDQQHGWAITDRFDGERVARTLMRTTDGGATWSPVSQAPDDPKEYYNTLWFVDQQVGFVGSRKRLAITTDGGETFQNVDETEDSGYEFQFTDRSHGWKIKDFKLYATADGGKTWEPLGLQSRVIAYQLLPGGVAWVIGGELANGSHRPSLLSTTDGGKSWTRFDLGDLAITGLRFADATHGLLSGSEGQLYATEDGGRTWSQLR